MTPQKLPPISGGVWVCQGCHHWQADVSNAVRQEVGGSVAALLLIAAANAEHLSECPGQGGRVKVLGQWVERPTMPKGNKADGLLGFMPYPAWVVAK